jgi:hypothetical protein
MVKHFRGLFAFVVAACFVTAVVADDDKKVDLSKLPEKVVAAFKAKYPDAKVSKAGSEKEDGKTVYEIAFKFEGHKYEVTFEEDGAIVDIEKQINFKDLPEAVSRALEEKYPKADYKLIEEVTKKDKVDSYEILLVTSEKKAFEVLVSPEGKITKETAQKPKAEESKEKKEDKD